MPELHSKQKIEKHHYFATNRSNKRTGKQQRKEENGYAVEWCEKATGDDDDNKTGTRYRIHAPQGQNIRILCTIHVINSQLS